MIGITPRIINNTKRTHHRESDGQTRAFQLLAGSQERESEISLMDYTMSPGRVQRTVKLQKGVAANAAKKPGAQKKAAPRMAVCKFDVDDGTVQSNSQSMFAKITLPAKGQKRPASLLSSTLVTVRRANTSAGESMGSRGSRNEKRLKLQVIFDEHLSNDDEASVSVEIRGPVTVSEAVALIIKRYKERPDLTPLPFTSLEAYELRMVEDDGDIDEDFPLSGDRDIHAYGIEIAALCVKDSYQAKMSQRGGHRKSTLPVGLMRQNSQRFSKLSFAAKGLNLAGSRQANGRRLTVSQNLSPEYSRQSSEASKSFFRIELPETGQSTILACENESEETLYDMLDQLREKKGNDRLREKYVNFYYQQDPSDVADTIPRKPLDLNTKLVDLIQDTLRLEMKGVFSKAHTGAVQDYSDFEFTKDKVQAYVQYSVIKKNKRGQKQARYLGFDLHKLYNKYKETGRFGRKKTNTPERNIEDVVQVKSSDFDDKISDKSNTKQAGPPHRFDIVFREMSKTIEVHNKVTYYAESAEDLREIVARLNFLIRLTKHSQGA